MSEQKDRVKKLVTFPLLSSQKEFYEIYEKHSDSKFLGYESLESFGKLLSITSVNGKTGLVFDQTLYGEGGGQMGDRIVSLDGSSFKVLDTKKPVHGVIVHFVSESESKF